MFLRLVDAHPEIEITPTGLRRIARRYVRTLWLANQEATPIGCANHYRCSSWALLGVSGSV
jgi:hypothetical protein